MVASYPLLSQAPTPVEVELGCDNLRHVFVIKTTIKKTKTNNDFGTLIYIFTPMGVMILAIVQIPLA